MSFAYTPATGLLDINTYIDKPINPRGDIQGLLDQIKVYLNKNAIYCVDTGTADALVVTLSPAPTSYTTDIFLIVKKSAFANTGAATINVNGLGAVSIKKDVSTALAAGDMLASGILFLKYDGTYFQYLNPDRTDAITTHSYDNVLQFAVINEKINSLGGGSNRIINGLSYDSESGHYDIWPATGLFDGVMTMSNAGAGWINQSGTVNPWVKMSMPIGVVIGDSISEGHTLLHGRLHQSDGSENLAALNSPGQISYHLEQYTKMKVYNQGIGGQRADQVRARWDVDVLASGTTHLPKIPNFVVLIVGINDVYADRTANAIETDLEWMIDSAITNDIYPIVFNIGPDDTITAPRLAVLKQVNSWLVTKAAETPEMCLIDFYAYMNDPLNDGHNKAGYCTDDVHPTKYRYERIARELIIDEAFTNQHSAVVPRYINFSSAFNLTAYTVNIARPIAILVSVDDVPKHYYILPNSPDQCIPIPFVSDFIDTVTITIIDHENAYEASGTGAYKGWAEIYLTDKNIFPEKFDSTNNGNDSVIQAMTADAGTVGVVFGRMTMMSGAAAGNVAYANAADITNHLGPLAVTAEATSYVAIKGVCQIEVDGTVYPGDYLVTVGTAGISTRSTAPTVGAIVGQVIKGRTGAGKCLARR